MSDSSRTKPTPARAKPTPARALNGESPSVPVEVERAEARLEVGGAQWTVRILGRSGRASGVSPSLLLLGFWQGEPDADEPALEVMVAGRELEGLSPRALEDALALAVKRRDPGQKAPFFPDAGQGSRR